MPGLAVESDDLVHHLLVDSAIKAAIVVAALAVLALGMVVIWRKAGRAHDRPGGADD